MCSSDLAFTLGILSHFHASQSTIGAGSAVTNQYGFEVDNTLTGATNNYGFYGNLAAASNVWNLYMAGTANNHMAGSLGIGTTTLTARSVFVNKSVTGATTGYGVRVDSAFQSDVTSGGFSFYSAPSTQATAFTLAEMAGYVADNGTIGAGSTVTKQYGFYATSGLTGATNNYGFYSNIASGSNRWNFYANGTADNYFAGNVGIGTSSPGYKLQVSGTAVGGTVWANVNNTDTTAGSNAGYFASSGAVNSVMYATSSAGAGTYGMTTNHPMVFITNNTERMRIDSSGNVGIGTSSPTNLLDLYNATSAVINVQGDSSTAIFASRYGTNTAAPVLGMQKYRGSYGSPSIVSSGDNTGRVIFYGYDGASSVVTAEIRSYVDGTPGSGDMPGRLSFWTTADGASSATERARIDSSGNVLVTNPAGLGYGTGSGGTVTQATNKSTGVTLNKPTGQITMNNAALAAGASVQFVVTNSLVAASDVVVVTPSNNANYSALSIATLAGSFYIRVTNITAGSLSEALVLNYTVIKGATS